MCKRLVCFSIMILCCFASAIQAKDLEDLSVLYVGSERPNEYVEFLEPFVKRVEGVSREGFDPRQADACDVVLLDWPQSSEARSMRELTSPLGERENWSKPTMLLGSAGLNLAVAWKMVGGSGCTCLDPMAYDLRDHPIFQHPYAIVSAQTITIDTPESFQDDLDAATIEVLPLVDDVDRQWRSGWCTYSTYFDLNPDVEFFCGGVNAKTPTAAAIWRQGNLLHFGFEQSPAEMNDAGRQMLLNSIRYISDFRQDRPIAITPSVFAGPIARPRETVAKWLANPDRADWVENLVTPEVWAEIATYEDAEQRTAWAKERTKYFRPNNDKRLLVDEDLQALEMGFDDPRFVERMIVELRSGETERLERAERLLGRYVPARPGGGDAEQWNAWWNANQRYAFASDFGEFRWYIDPLAKQRGVPTEDQRGPARADE